ncbi:MAG: hypothetical protein JSR46_12415 [Verrucomicrobia bacterium]|nr:hypothetical protein [Verrucomicrobiota bacterium]
MSATSDNYSIVPYAAMVCGTLLTMKGMYDVGTNHPVRGRIELGLGAALCLIGGIAERYLYAPSEPTDRPSYRPTGQPYAPSAHGIWYAERNRKRIFNEFDVCIKGATELVKIVSEKIWVCYPNGTQETCLVPNEICPIPTNASWGIR